VWDGQVLLAVLDGENHPVVTLMRGLDLSGTMQGAGGVGGLLAVSLRNEGAHFVCYDGNGNVVALVNAADGSESGRYEYGPFGELLRVTGPVAKANPLRFSTQYADDMTGEMRYLFPDYAPATGRWPNRDPIGEKGGINAYGFVGSSPLNAVDPFGFLEVEATTEGFEVTVWGVTKKIGPNGGEAMFEKTISQSDASVPLVGGYSIDVKSRVALKLLSIPAKACFVKNTPFRLNSDFSVHLWPPPANIRFTLEVANGDAATGRISLTQTISFPDASVSYTGEFEGKSRVWGGICGISLEIKSHVKGTASFRYNYILVLAAASALATGPIAILTEPLPAAIGP
jgi:RHS repeat-associated protein